MGAEITYLLEAMRTSNIIVSMSVLVALALWESLAPYFRFFVRKKAVRLHHAFRNLTIGAINALMVSLIFSGLWMASAVLSEKYQWGLCYRLGLSFWPHTIAAVLLMDLWTYWWHRINHEVPFFWRFHKVHHSDEFMDVTTAYRFHMGEITFSSLFRIALLFILGIQLWQLVCYELLMFVCVQFHHANISLSPENDRKIRALFVTPAMHKVHHSREPSEFNTNYTSLLSVWDRLFRTFHLHSAPEEIHFGIEGYDDEEWQSINGMMKTPFVADDDH